MDETADLPAVSDSLTSERSFNQMDNSQFGQVIFQEVDDVYLTDCDLRCKYTLTDVIQPMQGDRIALYKVGWKFITDYLVFKLAPIPLEEKGYPTLRIAFQASMLPKDENELYQLCYLTVDNLVVGASVPFGFRRPSANELVAVEDKSNQGMMVYRSRAAILYDRIASIEDEKETLELKVTALLSQLRVLEKELASAASANKVLTASVASIRLDFDTEKEMHLEIKKKYQQLFQIYEDCKKKFEIELSDKDKLVEKIKVELQDTVKQLKSTEVELTNIKAEKAERDLIVEQLVEGLKRKIMECGNELLDKDKLIDKTKSELQDTVNQLKSTDNELTNIKAKKIERERMLEQLVNNLNVKLLECDREMLAKDELVDETKSKLQDTVRQLESTENDLTKSRAKKVEFDKELSDKDKLIEKTKGELQDTVNQLKSTEIELSNIQAEKIERERMVEQLVNNLNGKLVACDSELLIKDKLLNKTNDELQDTVRQLKSTENELTRIIAEKMEKELMLEQLTQYTEQLKTQLENAKYEQASYASPVTVQPSRPIEQQNCQQQLMEKYNKEGFLGSDDKGRLEATLQLLESTLQVQAESAQKLAGVEALQKKIDGLTAVNSRLSEEFNSRVNVLKKELDNALYIIQEKEKEVAAVRIQKDNIEKDCALRLEDMTAVFESVDKDHNQNKKILEKRIVELESCKINEDKVEELTELVESLRGALLQVPMIEEQWRLLLESARVLAKNHHKDLLNNFEFLECEEPCTRSKIQQLLDNFYVLNQCLETSKEQNRIALAEVEKSKTELFNIKKVNSVLEMSVTELKETINEIENCLNIVHKDAAGADVKLLKKQLEEMLENKIQLEKELKEVKTARALTSIGQVTVDQSALMAEIDRLRRRLAEVEACTKAGIEQSQSSSECPSLEDPRKHCEKLQDHLKKSATEYAKLYRKFLNERQHRIRLQSLVPADEKTSTEQDCSQQDK